MYPAYKQLYTEIYNSWLAFHVGEINICDIVKSIFKSIFQMKNNTFKSDVP